MTTREGGEEEEAATRGRAREGVGRATCEDSNNREGPATLVLPEQSIDRAAAMLKCGMVQIGRSDFLVRSTRRSSGRKANSMLQSATSTSRHLEFGTAHQIQLLEVERL